MTERTLPARNVTVSLQRLDILAAPQLLDDERVRQQQEDLALVLVVATWSGSLRPGRWPA